MTDEDDGSLSPGNHRRHTSAKKRQPGILVSALRSVFGYRKTSLSLFVITTIFVVVLVSYIDNSLLYTVDLPLDQVEKKLVDETWLDLQLISQHEHPYGSIANDEVHKYLENRINELIRGIDYIKYDNDLNGTNKILFEANSKPKIVTYYESNNLLVQIEGRDKTLPAFLLSAHFDSVPTSYGVTDDGMGVASLLGVLSYYSKQERQPKRTIIFNFNNNEEFGLFGAKAFTYHPWFKKVKYFLNLEGTGAGGKAILFRGTDYGIVKYFSKVRFPYASSIFQQGFSSGLVHSETDYVVYKEAGLRGLDLAFYKPRDIYHTAEDNIKNIRVQSLWHMLSNAIDFTKHMAENEIDDVGSNDSAMYTSFFNNFFAISSSQLIMLNLFLILVFPILNGLLMFYSVKSRKWVITWTMVLVLPLTIILAMFVTYFAVTNGFQEMNQFLPSSKPLLLVATTTSILLLLYSVFSTILNRIFHVASTDPKLLSIIVISFLYWVLLIYTTNGLANNAESMAHTGELFFTILFALQGTASFLGLLGWSLSGLSRKYLEEEEEEGEEEEEEEGGGRGRGGGGGNDEEPLLDGSVERYVSDGDDDEDENGDASGRRQHDKNPVKHLVQHFGYDWSLQYLLTVPVSLFLIYNSGWLVLDGVNKTMQESLSGETFVYGAIQVFSFSLIVPLIPFIHKLNRYMVFILIAVVLFGSAIISIEEPFNEQNPLKLRLLQTVNDDQSSSVEVFGREGVIYDVISKLPSVVKSSSSPSGNVKCSSIAEGNEICTYKTELIPNILPPGASYIDIKITNSKSSSYGINFNEVIIKAPKNRMCNLHFRKEEVKAIVIGNTTDIPPFKQIPNGYSYNNRKSHFYKDISGIEKLFLNKLDWEEPYNLAFYWLPSINDDSNLLNFTIDCFWADLAPVSRNNETLSAIPAYEELIKYTPNYVTWANKDRGLVSVSKSIAI